MNTPGNDSRDSWEKFLNPTTLKQNLISAGVFLAAYEMLVDALVDQLRTFYSHSWSREKGWEIAPEYREKVLSLDKKEVVACAKWFKESGAISEEDLLLLREIIEHRNSVAHDLPELLSSKGKDVSVLHLRGILYLTEKLDRWWIANVEVPTSPDFDDLPPTPEQLQEAFSLRMVTMSLLIRVAEGDDEGLKNLYEHWKAKTTAAKSAS